jgi:NADPH:quinone reductase-like Zn-dependent oxidoreductase
MPPVNARVVVATDFGGPEVLAVVDQEVPDPQGDEVRVAVRAAGVNPIDVKVYSGAFGTDRSELPRRLGAEAAGLVTAVGPDSSVAVGEEVIAFRAPGAYASELVVPGDAVVAKPAGLGWHEAAGLLLTGGTAVHTLTATSVGAGDTVLVHGGSGGVGLMAVQLARLRGARVVATASERNHDLLRSLGAEPVTYGDGLADRVRALAPDGVDAAVDTVGNDEAMDVSLELVPDRRRIATIANFDRAPREGVQLLGNGPGADPGQEVRYGARDELARLAAAGQLRVVVAGVFPFDRAADAHRQVASGHTTGKVVLVP